MPGDGASNATARDMLIGYARVSTNAQDLTAQRNELRALGVDGENIHVDHGPTGTNRERPGLREALAAVRAGDTVVVPKLDRLGPVPAGALSTTQAILLAGYFSMSSGWSRSSNPT